MEQRALRLKKHRCLVLRLYRNDKRMQVAMSNSMTYAIYIFADTVTCDFMGDLPPCNVLCNLFRWFWAIRGDENTYSAPQVSKRSSTSKRHIVAVGRSQLMEGI